MTKASGPNNIRWEPGLVDLEDRARRSGHLPLCVWITGLSGAGKSTVAKRAEKLLFDEGYQAMRLDGDNVRHGVNADLGFSEADREENIRRVAQVARLFYDFGHIVLCTFISPAARHRDYARSLFSEGQFLEVYLRCPIEEAERRDPKGLYRKARAGHIKNFTGIDAPYEEPSAPEILCDTATSSEADVVGDVVAKIRSSARL